MTGKTYPRAAFGRRRRTDQTGWSSTAFLERQRVLNKWCVEFHSLSVWSSSYGPTSRALPNSPSFRTACIAHTGTRSGAPCRRHEGVHVFSSKAKTNKNTRRRPPSPNTMLSSRVTEDVEVSTSSTSKTSSDVTRLNLPSATCCWGLVRHVPWPGEQPSDIHLKVSAWTMGCSACASVVQGMPDDLPPIQARTTR